MKVTFLGTGTSVGVPVIGCGCEVCRSENPRNKRTRSSVLVTDAMGRNLLVDASIDFRAQALRAQIDRVTHILITHTHADHVFGLDDTRLFSFKTGLPVNLYLDAASDKRIRSIFSYAYDDSAQKGGGLPKFNTAIIEPGQAFSVHDFTIVPIPIFHGALPILGYRIDRFAYLTDCSTIPDESYAFLKDLDVLVLDALRIKPHPTHFSLDEAVSEARKIGAKQTYFTHITHAMDHDEINRTLPDGIQLAHDELVLEI